jgi:pilin isopeptide linkage protein
MKKLKRKINKVNALLLSIVMFITMLTPYSAVFAAPVDQTANSDIVRSLELSYKLKSGSSFINLEAPYEIPDSSLIDSFRAIYGFEIEDNENIDTGEPERTITAGDFYMIELPDELRITTPANGSILGNGGRPIANYTFIEDIDESWSIKVEFTDYVDDLNEFNIFGSMQFDFTFDLSLVVQGTTETIYIPIDDTNGINLEITVPLPPPTTPTSLTKSVVNNGYNHLTRELEWNVLLQPATGVFSGTTFTDTIDVTKHQLKSIRHGSITLVENVDYTYDSSTGLLTYLIPTGRDGSSFQNIRIITTVNRDVYGSLLPTIINNTANLSGGAADVNINSNQASYTVTPSWLSKSGAVIDGNRIQWTIRANNTRQDMYNAVITDNLSADLVLDKTSVELDGSTIPIYDNTHTPASDTEVYGVYVLNPDNTSVLSIYLPRGVDNSSTSVRTITLETSVVSPTNPTPTSPTYTNEATLDANFVGDGDGTGNGVGTITGANITTTGVNIPNVSINKGNQTITAEDRRNGTITWTLSAVSNLSTYGASQIVDTLPNDQDYLIDEIYWGTQKIDSTTEPKAEISTNGRTLTISFATSNALQTIQNFTIKTKIKQDVYGQNLDRNFTNQVRVALFSESTGLEITSATDTHSVRIRNSVIAKSNIGYTGNTTQQAQNPRVNFSIVVNSNLMELNDLKITDDLSQILTQFRRNSESSYSTISGVKWTFVPGSLQITRTAGTRDIGLIDLAEITSNATYINDIISIDFGDGVEVNDSYTVRFTAELDVEQNPIFKENGTIRLSGNIGEIEALGLNGTISSNATANVDIKNEILGKSGIHLVDAQQALWTINLNQYGSELNSTRVVDILPLGLTLDPTSIKLYTDVIGTNGNFVTGSQVESQGVLVPFTYTYEAATEPGLEGRYILTVNLPDNNLAYILRFATDIDNSILGTQVNNSAYYVGEGVVEENVNESTITISSTVGGGSTTKTSLTVNKYNKDNDIAIDGAVFSLYWLRGGNPEDPVFVRSLTTTSGSVIFRGLTRGENYTIVETSAPSGYRLDNPQPVLVEVPADISGNLASVNFNNSPIKTGSWNPEAIKDLDGTGFVRPFYFEVLDGDTQVFTGVTGENLPNGRKTVDFTLNDGIVPDQFLNFSDGHIFPDDTENGTSHLVLTKTLTMKESNSNLPGYVIDDNEYEFTINVYNIKGEENLVVQIEDEEGNIISDDQGNFTPENIPIFFNEYSANGEFVFDVTKKLIGQELAAGQFTFNLFEGETLLDTATNEKGIFEEDGSYLGSVVFDKLLFTQSDVGLKTYTITEENSGLPGYTYDTSIYTVEIRVTDNDDGTIRANIESITKMMDEENPIEVETIDFLNSYTSLELNIMKYLKGKSMVDDEFSFIIQQINLEDGSIIGEEVIGKNDSEGNVIFPDVTFDLEDLDKTFLFNVTELNEKNPVYTYDSTKYTITATVVQNEDGTLSLEQDNFKVGILGLEEVDDFTFNNTYIGSIPQTGGMLSRYLLTTMALTSIGTLLIIKSRKLKKEKN